jgi:hypothetical protein
MFLISAYSKRMNMRLNVDVQVDDEDWKSASITWIKTFFGMQFQTYIHDFYVGYIIQQVKDTMKLPNFDPNTINDLQDNSISSRVLSCGTYLIVIKTSASIYCSCSTDESDKPTTKVSLKRLLSVTSIAIVLKTRQDKE